MDAKAFQLSAQMAAVTIDAVKAGKNLKFIIDKVFYPVVEAQMNAEKYVGEYLGMLQITLVNSEKAGVSKVVRKKLEEKIAEIKLLYNRD